MPWQQEPVWIAAPRRVIVLQPYGSLFFAAAPVFEAALPAVGTGSRGSVVILRLRGRTDLGTTFMDVLHRYAVSLVGCGVMVLPTGGRAPIGLALPRSSARLESSATERRSAQF
jgi:SulP family sulfate permease